MAYMNQERKAKLAPAIKELCKKYGVKASIGVNNHSTLVVNIMSGKLDFIKQCKSDHIYNDHIQVNEYCIDKNFTGKSQKFLLELKEAMMVGNHNNSDIQSDYWDVGWWISINVGKWNKPYQYIA